MPGPTLPVVIKRVHITSNSGSINCFLGKEPVVFGLLALRKFYKRYLQGRYLILVLAYKKSDSEPQ